MWFYMLLVLVSVSVLFHLLRGWNLIRFSNLAEIPPFGKELLIRFTICFVCYFHL